MHHKLPFGIFISSFVLSILLSLPGFANNLEVKNVSLTGQNTSEKYAYIRFDISWENSWRTSVAPNNWDAAWIFAKYRVGTGTWNHVTLSTGHIAPAGSTISAPADNVGVFLYRDADGTGTFNKTGVKLKWNYAANGIDDDDQVEVKVFGIEMVYVNEGAFYVGGTTPVLPNQAEGGRFYTYPDINTPYYIDSENSIDVGITAGNLYYSFIKEEGDQAGPIPSPFPKGYKSIYVMKHEVPHHAYVDFLNCLTRVQQAARTSVNVNPGKTSVEFVYVMVFNSSRVPPLSPYSSIPERRSSIRCNEIIPEYDPITFYCDLNNNGIRNEEDDGQHIACIYPSWSDAMAYLDWTGLRPMTELEFEKACRGPVYPEANEYAWGTNSITNTSNLNNERRANETSSNPASNVTVRANNILAPTRVGMHAKPLTDRQLSGATYYGILDMTGNLWERPVTVGNSAGRSFTGQHGDGTITPAGKASVVNWPALDGLGSGYRGGYWNSTASEDVLCIAGRKYAAQPSDVKKERYGIRGVRTAP